MKSNKLFVVASVLYIFFICNISRSQFSNTDKYQGEFAELFFGRQPSARAEAMARSFVSIIGDANSYYYNPAGLASLEGLNVSGTYANPYYAATEAKYNFLSASYRIKNYGVIGFSRDYFKLGDGIITNELGEKQGEFSLHLRNYRLSLASEILKDFFIGVNINLFHGYDYSNGFSVGNETGSNGKDVFYLDLGIIKSLNFQIKNIKHTLNFGTSIINLNSAKYTYIDPLQASRLPVILD